MASLNIYTTNNMRDVYISSITSETTAKEGLIDNRPNSVWIPGSTATQTIDFQFLSSITVQAVILFVQNYASITAGSFQVWYYDGGWTAAEDQSIVDTNGPLRILDESWGIAAQQWRIKLINMSEIARIGGIWFAKKYTVSVSPTFPRNDGVAYNHRMLEGPFGQRFVQLGHSRYQRMTRLQYAMGSSSDYTSLRNAYIDSLGNGLPLIAQFVGESDHQARLCHFENAELQENREAHEYYRPTFTLRELQYIPSGESF
jgi:hypothetical protein